MASPESSSEPATEPTSQEQILAAAEARFRRYGYGKSTMAEIAGDCGMSAANLYRYFANKQEIRDACCLRCVADQLTVLRAVARGDGDSAAVKLEVFVLTALGHVHEMFANEPHMAELVFATMESGDSHIREAKLEPMVALLAEILAEGNRSGEFSVDNVLTEAQTVLAATFAFHAPFLTLSGLYTPEELTDSARKVVALLVRGLRRG